MRHRTGRRGLASDLLSERRDAAERITASLPAACRRTALSTAAALRRNGYRRCDCYRKHEAHDAPDLPCHRRPPQLRGSLARLILSAFREV
jgi:hypothetical protein